HNAVANATSLCGETEAVHTGSLNSLYYVFYESRIVPSDHAPLVIWLSGGPGCSSLVGMLFENGPCLVGEDSSTAKVNPSSWTNAAHMVYIDQPRGTGFSLPRQDREYALFNISNCISLGIGNGLTSPSAMFSTVGEFAAGISKGQLTAASPEELQKCHIGIQRCQEAAQGGFGDCSMLQPCDNIMANLLDQVRGANLNYYDLRAHCNDDDAFHLCYRFSPLYDFVNAPSTRAVLGIQNKTPVMASIFFKQDTVEDSSLCGEPEPRHTGFLNGLYYIFYESRVRSVVAESVPLVIWLSGGPGCSSLVGMLFENGPCIVGEDSPTTISLNVNSWTQAAHMVYIDQPRGTGFSPARASLRSWSEATAVDDLVSFLDEFYTAFPTFASNELYIFGESYAGHYIPDLAHELLLRNSRAFQNLKGIGTIELANYLHDKAPHHHWYMYVGIGNGLTSVEALFDTLGPFVKSVNNDILLTEANDYVESCEEAIQACQDPAIGGQGDCSKVYRQGLNHYNLDRKCHSDMFRLCYRFQPLYTFVNSQATMAKLGISGHSWAPCNSDVFAGHLQARMTPFLSEINEDMLRQFEDEFDAQKSKVEQAREMLKHKKSLEIQKQVESMRATVANLDKDVLESRENRKSLRNRLMERKALMKTHMAEHQELRRCTWNVERTHQLEGAAQRRLDLERLQDERKRMESLLDAATIELDAIESEKRRRQETVEVQMKRILDKGTVLKQQLEDGHLDIPEVRRTIQDHGHEQFVQECHGLRRLQQQQRVLDQHKRQKELNVERAKLVADEDILRQQMHLQAADPTGLIGATECDDCVDDVVAQACQILATGDATLSALQNSIVEKTNVVNTNAAAAAIPPAYNGSLGPQSYPPWLEASREMAQSLIMEVALEASCWKHVLFQPVANLVMPITAVCVHFCRVQNEFVLCAGGAKGELALVDVGTSTVLRQRLDPPQPGRTASIQSFGSQFLVYAPFQLKLWTSRPVKGMALSVVFNLTKADLALPGRELQDVTTGCFVPAASLSGTSSSIVVGTADGSILRLNRSTDDVRPVFGASSLESPNPNPLNNSRQEHFQFHRAAIVFLACVGTTPSSLTILSVDVTGIVCHWTNANWTGFGWFEPAQSLQLVGPGVVQSAQLTTDSSRLVVFTFDAATRQGVFIQLTWQPLLAAMSTVIRIGCMSPPPPFTILPPLAALSRTACDSVLVMGSTLAMYSLGTGQVLTPASASSMECKSQAVSVTCSDGYVVGCGANGKIMAFQMQDLSSIDAVHAARRLAQPFNHQTQRQSR
ncbi:hypothetical protein B5M09_001784, partial [Aphanomyces astaci]